MPGQERHKGRHGAHSAGKNGKRGKGASHGPKRAKKSTGRREEAEVQHLQKRLETEMPKAGENAVSDSVKRFADLPLSAYTQSGLKTARFTHMTQIQRMAIPHALAGRDVLAAAKTGSGKTLAFMVPVVEALYRDRWSSSEGVGALIISPTRELAMQIFEVVKVVCAKHFSLTAGYVTGGKDVAAEARFIPQLNIIVATPGRLLHHLEQTPGFDTTALRMLVLDEADRLLDMGFEEQLNAILGYLPPDRQTLLFSATQTRSVQALARLSLRDPEYVAVNQRTATATPVKLSQFYTICGLEDKMNMVYSFIKSHIRCKTIVFLSSCKQARFAFEAMRRVRPGVSVMALHGKQKPKKRSLVYMTFLEKKAAVLFATDVAARGLDFPHVNWVVQLDCPESTESYIHRVGRTARYRNKGNGLLVLLPSERKMVAALKDARIPLKQIKVNAHRAVSVQGKVAAEVAADPELRQLAKKAFSSYVRSVFLQPNKDVFDVHELPLRAYAESLGLPDVPKSKFLEGASTRTAARKKKNMSKKLQKLRASIAAAKKAKAGVVDDPHAHLDSRVASGSESDSEDDDFLRPKGAMDAQASDASDVDEAELTRGLPMGLGENSRRKVVELAKATKELGEARAAMKRGEHSFADFAAEAQDGHLQSDLASAAANRVAQVAQRLRTRDAADRARERRRIKAKHLQERLATRSERGDDVASSQGAVVTLGSTTIPASDDDEDFEGSRSSEEESSASDDEAAQSDAPDAESRRTRPSKRKREAPLSIEDAESMALQLLQRPRLT